MDVAMNGAEQAEARPRPTEGTQDAGPPDVLEDFATWLEEHPEHLNTKTNVTPRGLHTAEPLRKIGEDEAVKSMDGSSQGEPCLVMNLDGAEQLNLNRQESGDETGPDENLPRRVSRKRKFVRFKDIKDENKDRRKLSFRWLFIASAKSSLRCAFSLKDLWLGCAPLLVNVARCTELWTGGVWLAFITEDRMAQSLKFVLFIDIFCNAVVLLNGLAELTELVSRSDKIRSWARHKTRKYKRRRKISLAQAEDEEEAKKEEEEEHKHEEEHHQQHEGTEPDPAEGAAAGAAAKGAPGGPNAAGDLAQENVAEVKKRAWYYVAVPLSLWVQIGLSTAFLVVQGVMYYMITTGRSHQPAIALPVMVIVLVRLVGSASRAMEWLNGTELDVYVQVRIQGTTRARNLWVLVMKQVITILVWAHWTGCIMHALKEWSHEFYYDIDKHIPAERDYFEHYAESGKLAGYTEGNSFLTDYMLSLYKGINWNLEDLKPEKLMEILAELLSSIFFVGVRAYCIGGFFRYHSKTHKEMHLFNQLMESVGYYMELCDLPPSLRKEINQHFRFHQEKRYDVLTIEVLAKLPYEAQKKLNEQSIKPIVIGRNSELFHGLSHEFGMMVVMLLEANFLQPGEVVFVEGSTARELAFLETGSVSLSRKTVSEGGKAGEHVMYFLRADRQEDHTVLGEVAFLLGQPHMYSTRVRQGTEAVLLMLSKTKFDEELVSAYPEQHEIMMRNMAYTMLLDIQGGDLQAGSRERKAEHDSEHFLAMQAQVREMLRQRHEDMNATFTFAAGAGDQKLVSEMLTQKVNVNTADYDGRSALHLAATEGMTETLELLLQANGNANCKDRWGSTPLQDALKNGCGNAAALLRRYGGELLVDNVSGLLCTLASEGDITKMGQLIDFGVDVDAGDYDMRTALHLAAGEGRLAVVSFLTSHSANVNAKDRWDATPLQEAIRNGHIIVAKHLRQCGGKDDGEFSTNLMCDSASTGDLAQLRLLTEDGLDVDAGDYDRRTSMHLAAAEGQILSLHYLLKAAKANPSPLDRWNATPLQDAIVEGHEMCINLLLTEGGQLGPQAPPEMKAKIDTLKARLFKNDGEEFWQLRESLRRQISNHAALVERGRAKADIFDLEEARQVNMKIVGAQINLLPRLTADAGKLLSVFRRLDEAGLEPMRQMQRLLEDGEVLASASHFWQHTRLESEKHMSSTAKDSKTTVFDEIFFGTTTIGPKLENVVDRIAARVLHRVEVLYDQRFIIPGYSGARSDVASQAASPLSPKRNPSAPSVRAGQAPPEAEEEPHHSVMPRLSELMVEELFEALGWEGGAMNGGQAFLDKGAASRRRRLSHKIEELAAGFLPMEHLVVRMQRGVLDERVCGEIVGQHLMSEPDHGEFDRWLKLDGKHSPYVGLGPGAGGPEEHSASAPENISKLGAFVEAHTHQVLSGKEPDVQAPAEKCEDMQDLVYGLLFSGAAEKSNMRSSAFQKQLDEHLIPPTPGQHDATRILIALELAVMALTALLLDIWDKGTSGLNVKGAGVGLKVRSGLGDGTRAILKRSASQSSGTSMEVLHQLDTVTAVQPSAFESLVRVMGKAESACRGRSAMGTRDRQRIQQEERKRARHLLQEKRKAMHEQKGEKGLAGEAAPAEQGLSAADAVAAKLHKNEEDDHHDEHKHGIQMTKIMGFEGNLDAENLMHLLDFADEVDHKHQDHRHHLMFGQISRNRFAFNVMRWILNHDERQKSVLEENFEEGGPDVVQSALGGRRRSGESIASNESNSGPVTHIEKMSDGTAVKTLVNHLDLYHELENMEDELEEVFDDEDEVVLHEQQAALLAQQQTSALLLLEETKKKSEDKTRSSGCCPRIKRKWDRLLARFGKEGRQRRKYQQMARKFRELDEDGEGLGVQDVAKLLAPYFHYNLGREQELRSAQRVFELLEYDEIGSLVTLDEIVRVLPTIEDELREQQRKRRNVTANEDGDSTWYSQQLSRMVVPPDMWWLWSWDRVKIVFAIYYMIEAPLHFSFPSIVHIDGWMAGFQSYMNVFADVFMLLNMALNFFRSFWSPTMGFVTNFQEIRVHYLLNYFFMDGFACCPLDYFLPEQTDAYALNPTDVMARPRSAVRLIRLLHMRHLVLPDSHCSVSLAEERRRRMGDGFLRTALTLILILLSIVHFVACIWWIAGRSFVSFVDTGGQGLTPADVERWSWIYGYEAQDGEAPLAAQNGDMPFWWQYMISYWWSVGRISGMGSPGEMYPGSLEQVTLCCAFFLLSFGIGCYIDGTLASKVITRDEDAIKDNATQRIVEEFLQTVELPDEINQQIRSTIKTSAQTCLARRTDEVAHKMPYPLKVRIARRAFFSYFQAAQMFGGCSDNFLCEIGVCGTIVKFDAGSQIVYAGERPSGLLVLCRGRIVFMDAQQHNLTTTTRAGELIGHLPLLFGLRHSLGAKALEDTKFIFVSRPDFLAACKLYPSDKGQCVKNMVTILSDEMDFNEPSMDGRSRGLPRAPSGSSQGKGSGSGSGSRNGRSTGRQSSAQSSSHSMLARVYALELASLYEKAQQEQQEARQQVVCRMIDFAATGEAKRVEHMLQHCDVSVDEADYDSRTALHLAACGGHMEVVKLLVEKFNAAVTLKDRFEHTAMDDAVREQHTDIARYLMVHGARYQVDADVATQLCQAAFENDQKTLHLMLEVVGVDPNVCDYDMRTALHLATCAGHTELVEFLCQLSGINLSPKDRLGNTPFDDAMRHRQVPTRKVLQRYGAEMGAAHSGVLTCTLAAHNRYEHLRELGECGVAMSEGDYDARTGLHLAASEGHFEAATYLLNEAGVDPNPLDRFLCTPLDDAIREKHEALQSLLEDFGGLSGKDPRMSEQVAHFKSKMEKDTLRKAEIKLEKEVQKGEVPSLANGLRRFVEHQTLEEEIHNYVASAATFRKMLLRILERKTAPLQDLPPEDDDAPTLGTPGAVQHQFAQHTLVGMERLMDQATVAMDVSASKLILILDTEVLPWLTSLTKAEAKLLKIYVPNIKEVVTRLRDQLKARNRISVAVRKLRVQAKEGMSYQNTPIGLLVHRFGHKSMKMVAQARLDAMAMLWASRHPPHVEQSEKQDNKTPRQASKEKHEKHTPREKHAPHEKHTLHGKDATAKKKRAFEDARSVAWQPLEASHALRLALGSA